MTSAAPRPRPRGARIIAVAAFVVIAAGWLVGGGVIAALGGGGLVGALRLLGALALGVAGGAPAWLIAAPRRPAWLAVPIGLVIGLSVATLGVWASGLVGIPAVRWIPPLAALLLWIPVLRRPRRGRRRRVELARVATAHPVLLSGVAVGGALMLIAAIGYAVEARPGGDAVLYYVDLPWHAGNVAEAGVRAPSVYPSIPDTPFSMPWLYAALYGWLETVSGIPSYGIVAVAGPVVQALVIPALLGAVGVIALRSPAIGGVAALLFPVARGPLLTLTPTSDLTPLWISSNRDLANLLTLAALAAVAMLLSARRRREQVMLVALIAVTTFVGAGVKGSNAPLVLGAVGLVWLCALVLRRGRLLATAASVATVLAVLLQQRLITRSSGNTVIQPLSFERLLPADYHPRVVAAIVVVILLAMIAAGAVAALRSRRLVGALPLIGAAVAGVVGLAAFDHPGLSQLYFLHGAWPAFCLLLAGVVVVAVRALGARILLAPLAGAVVMHFAVALPDDAGMRRWALTFAAAAVAITLLGIAVALTRGRRRGAVVLALCLTAVTLQQWGPPRVEIPPAVAVDAGTAASVGAGQLEVLDVLRRSSAPDDLVMTNRHCRTGAIADGTCDPRWFPVAAFGERRSIVEGYGYSPRSLGAPVDDRYWHPAVLRDNDRFISAPTAELCRAFVERGARWVYVDESEPWSADLERFGELVASAPGARLYRLDSACTGGD